MISENLRNVNRHSFLPGCITEKWPSYGPVSNWQAHSFHPRLVNPLVIYPQLNGRTERTKQEPEAAVRCVVLYLSSLGLSMETVRPWPHLPAAFHRLNHPWVTNHLSYQTLKVRVLFLLFKTICAVAGHSGMRLDLPSMRTKEKNKHITITVGPLLQPTYQVRKSGS